VSVPEAPARPPIGHLWHVAIEVSNLPRMERFYMDVLGFLVEWKPDADNVYLTTGRDNLALHKGLAAAGGRLAHLGFVVAQPDDVDAWANYLRALGIPLEAEPRTHRDGARSLYLRDPEGNLIQILHHPPLAPYVD
jgi:catechol 2,3-dioxygenase-like lactoylglutathione lyase family enzyme